MKKWNGQENVLKLIKLENVRFFGIQYMQRRRLTKGQKMWRRRFELISKDIRVSSRQIKNMMLKSLAMTKGSSKSLK